MTDPAIVSRIKKLLKLADSQKNGNVQEAAAAAAKAQSLMEKHRIQRAMLIEDAGIQSALLIDKGQPANWKLCLASILARHNGCYITASAEYSKDNKVYIVGESLDISNIQDLYNYITSELIRFCYSEIIKLKSALNMIPQDFAASFYLGAIKIIDARILEAKQQTRTAELRKAISPEDQAALAYALQIIDSKWLLAKDWVTKNISQAEFKNITTEAKNPAAYNAGRRAAEQLDLNTEKKLNKKN